MSCKDDLVNVLSDLTIPDPTCMFNIQKVWRLTSNDSNHDCCTRYGVWLKMFCFETNL